MTFHVKDLDNPEGEEKRIVATLKSFGARNANNVDTYHRSVLIDGEPYVEIAWHSANGEYSTREWVIEALFDKKMQSPGDVKLTVLGSDGSYYLYTVPRSYLDRWISQRLGNDYVPEVYENYREFWIDIGGYKAGEYLTVPAWTQWSLGSFGFHWLKTTINGLLREDRFIPEDSLTYDQWIEQEFDLPSQS